MSHTIQSPMRIFPILAGLIVLRLIYFSILALFAGSRLLEGPKCN